MLMNTLVRRCGLVGRSCAALGVSHTVRSTLASALKRCSDAVDYHPETDRAFDRRFGTDTAARVEVEDLGIADAGSKQLALFYVPSPVQLVRYALQQLRIDYAAYQFVDYGCGKGRVLMVASMFPFRAVSGVEISSAVCDIARRNVEAFRAVRGQATQIDVQCLDARTAPLRDENTVFHFYHPFEGDLQRDVLERIARTFRNNGRSAFLIYSWRNVETLFPLFGELGFTMLNHTKTVNPRYQCAVFMAPATSAR